MQYRVATWLELIHYLQRRQPPMLIYFPTTPPPIQINSPKIPQPIQKNIDCRPAPPYVFCWNSPNFIHNTFIAAQFLFLKSSILEVAIILPKNLI